MSCKMTCHEMGLLWPKPTEHANLSKSLIKILPGDIAVILRGIHKSREHERGVVCQKFTS